jgi:hypothetical protein
VVINCTAVTGATEEYDGNSWTTSPNGLNTARLVFRGAGTQTAGLSFWWFTGYSCYRSDRRI